MDCNDLSPEEHKALQRFTKCMSGSARFVRKETGPIKRHLIYALLEMGYLERVDLAGKTMTRVEHPCECKKIALRESLRTPKGVVSIPAKPDYGESQLVDKSIRSTSLEAGAKSIRYDKPAKARWSVRRLVDYFKANCRQTLTLPFPLRTLSTPGANAIGKLFKEWRAQGATEEEVVSIIDLFFREMIVNPPQQELWRVFIARRTYWGRNIGKRTAPGPEASQEEQTAYWLGDDAEAILRRNADKLRRAQLRRELQ